MKQDKLSKFDRIGVGVVAFLGSLIGFLAVLTFLTVNHARQPDVNPVKVLLVALMFPGVWVGTLVAYVSGSAWAAAWISGPINGAAYGFVFYAWDRVANRVSRRLPVWCRGFAVWLARRRDARAMPASQV